MYEFLGLLCLVSLISIVVFTIMYFVGRRKNAKRAKRRALYAWVSLAVLIFSAWGINQTPEGKQEATEEAKQSARDSSIKKERDTKKASLKKVKIAKESSEKQAKKIAKASSASAKSSSLKEAQTVAKKHSQKSTKKTSTKKSSLASRYMPVSLASFAQNPIKYDEKFISTTGTVIYIQKNPDDNNMYYVVIVPTDEYTTSGMSDGHGTVTEIDIDTMKAHPIHEGDTITVKGSGLTNTVTLNGKTLKSDVIVDYVKVD